MAHRSEFKMTQVLISSARGEAFLSFQIEGAFSFFLGTENQREWARQKTATIDR